MIPVAPRERTCESRLCPEPKGRPVKSFPAKATLWTQSPLLPTNRGFGTEHRTESLIPSSAMRYKLEWDAKRWML